ncbi:hypothetical protein MINS_12050 [Mycolicibacterium insubricum]|uniref:hypothetical protein n=1 Tax=Mycolicibacterium insubricum TaxID=444597 RepID=UPI00138D72FE|nr:hypothetical protein [Mycolicibacterium insubricum]MCV7079991.1 hypothetical protein [Mycolicibacterium insubricum]BBZ65776.1 hypothetical protein MINS_12050 [Mycolicibacterium insubricum]
MNAAVSWGAGLALLATAVLCVLDAIAAQARVAFARHADEAIALAAGRASERSGPVS